MKKILVFICLMFLSSSAFSFNLGAYKDGKELATESVSIRAYLEGRISGTYSGLLAMQTLSGYNTKLYGTKSDIEWWCVPVKLSVNYQNLIDIIDEELERVEDAYGDDMSIDIVLYHGLLKTFPCE